MTAPALSDELEELFELEIRRGGCWLGYGSTNVVECDAPAEFVMVYTHGCKLYAPFKCRKHVDMHMADLSRCESTGFSCAHCDQEFYDIPSFVRYGKL